MDLANKNLKNISSKYLRLKSLLNYFKNQIHFFLQ